ncbi:hypothetical protein BKA61DRAFT_622661 [Leptodontidium sp. MPI-SDFR-AT-0119]|nr:hypothetical protein BKA61DRAFT_622661 [Leptodontidium sp. MPI-SDFR-AT-0119]
MKVRRFQKDNKRFPLNQRMSQPVLRHLRRVQAFLGRPSDDADEAPPSPTDPGTPENIREDSPFDVLGDPPILPQIKHSNIATIEEIYCYGRIFLVVEHLDVSFGQLDFQKYDLEEREIATILFEVLKGVAYVSSLRLSCRDLSQENIWLSLDGDIKLVLDPRELKYDGLYESPKVSQVLLDFPILAEIIEEMMLSRYHLAPDDEKWSRDAIDFISCTLEGSFESLINVRSN